MRREQHIANAEAALVTYCRRVDPDGSNDTHTNVGDLLADLMHYCDAKDVAWADALAQAERHYEGDPTEPDFDFELTGRFPARW